MTLNFYFFKFHNFCKSSSNCRYGFFTYIWVELFNRQVTCHIYLAYSHVYEATLHWEHQWISIQQLQEKGHSPLSPVIINQYY